MVDTDVIAAALLGEPGTAEEASRVLTGTWPLTAPAHWMAELANVVWKAVRLDRLDPALIDDVLTTAESLPIEPVAISALWRGAVAQAAAADHPAYDTLFVELAGRVGGLVVSYDRKLRQRFPEQVRHPGEIPSDPPPS